METLMKTGRWLGEKLVTGRKDPHNPTPFSNHLKFLSWKERSDSKFGLFIKLSARNFAPFLAILLDQAEFVPCPVPHSKCHRKIYLILFIIYRGLTLFCWWHSSKTWFPLLKEMLQVLYVIFGVWHSLCYRLSAARAYIVVTAADLISGGGAIIVETLSSIFQAIYIVIH